MIILSISINFIAGFDVAKTGDARIGFVGEWSLIIKNYLIIGVESDLVSLWLSVK